MPDKPLAEVMQEIEALYGLSPSTMNSRDQLDCALVNHWPQIRAALAESIYYDASIKAAIVSRNEALAERDKALGVLLAMMSSLSESAARFDAAGDAAESGTQLETSYYGESTAFEAARDELRTRCADAGLSLDAPTPCNKSIVGWPCGHTEKE